LVIRPGLSINLSLKSKTAELLDWSLKIRKGDAAKTLETDKKRDPVYHSPRRLTKGNRKIRKTP
jgi:hypothetical protein